MMLSAVFATFWLWTTCDASVLSRQATSGGSGPYPASYSTDAGLAGQTIYMPTTVPADLKLPVIVYGVGGCSDSGTNTLSFHNEIASHGFLVIVNNGPTTRGVQTVATSLTAAADWVYKVAGTGKYANVDKTRMAVSGWSCGGLQAYTVNNDTRFSTVGIFSSGEFTAADGQAIVGKINKPIFYFLGGSSDIAYANGERDYTYLSKTVPAWLGNDGLGHFHGTSGTFTGVSINTGAVRWAEWLLRGNTTSAKFFTDNTESAKSGWSAILSQNLDKITVTPI